MNTTLDDIRKAVVTKAESGQPKVDVEILSEARFRILDTIVEKHNFSFLAIGRPESAGCYCKVNTSCCSRFMAQHLMRERKKYLAQLCEEYHADGLIIQSNKFCEYWSYERTIDSLIIPRDFNIPVCSIEKEYINSASGQLRTRFQAFVESVELKKLHSAKNSLEGMRGEALKASAWHYRAMTSETIRQFMRMLNADLNLDGSEELHNKTMAHDETVWGGVFYPWRDRFDDVPLQMVPYFVTCHVNSHTVLNYIDSAQSIGLPDVSGGSRNFPAR